MGFPAIGTRGVLTVLYLTGLTVGGVCLWRLGITARRPATGLTLLLGLAVTPLLVPPAHWQVYAAGRATPTSRWWKA